MKPDITVRRATKRRNELLPTHEHEEAQLTFAASGMVQIHVDDGRWLVPPQLVAWIPPGTRHRLEAMTDCELWVVHWNQAALEEWSVCGTLDRAFASRVTPLLRCLLGEVVAAEPISARAGLIARLMLHELSAVPDAPTFLPLPESATGRRVADAALADHRGVMDASALASRSAISLRSLSRLFPAETGLTFKTWRQRARIVQAMERLAQGHSPAKVAGEMGYSSTAAFSHAFRQVTGLTPTAFPRP